MNARFDRNAVRIADPKATITAATFGLDPTASLGTFRPLVIVPPKAAPLPPTVALARLKAAMARNGAAR